MSKSHKNKRKSNPPPPAAPAQRFPRAIAVALLLGAAAAAGWYLSKGRPSDAGPAPTPTAMADATNQPAIAATSNPRFEKLKGKWLRPDGGYIVDIRSVQPDGKMDATYSNPQPIHVEKAVAIQDGEVTKVFIELRDVNYPGSTYTLAYDSKSDRLTGIYYQAHMQQQFEVEFLRIK